MAFPLNIPVRTGLSTAAQNPRPANPSAVGPADLVRNTASPNLVAGAAAAAANMGDYRLPTEQIPFWMTLDISNYSRVGWNTPGTFNRSGGVIFPMPDNIDNRTYVRYEEKPIGVLGAAAMAAGGAYSDWNTATAELRKRWNETSGADQLQGGLGRLAFQAAIGNGGALGNVASGAAAALGFAVNDYMTLMLQGPTYKEYQMRWRFSPKNPTESATLKSVYKLLNNAASVSLPGAFLASMFWGYPDMFQLAFHTSLPGVDMGSNLFRFKPAFLVDQQWDFTPDQQPSFFAGTGGPTSLGLVLHFKEMQYWLKGDYV